MAQFIFRNLNLIKLFLVMFGIEIRKCIQIIAIKKIISLFLFLCFYFPIFHKSAFQKCQSSFRLAILFPHCSIEFKYLVIKLRPSKAHKQLLEYMVLSICSFCQGFCRKLEKFILPRKLDNWLILGRGFLYNSISAKLNFQALTRQGLNANIA